jgi:predicted GNAT family N-acyltransferase
MAILSPFRRQGIGMAILRVLIDLAKREQTSFLVLHSQVIAIPFYEKLGFKGDGPIYDEAGILHRNMMLSLANVLL